MNEILRNLMTVLDREHAEAVIEHRSVTIKKKLTPFAAKLLAKRFAEWGDANEAAEMMIERCWQGFDPAWARNAARPAHQRLSHQHPAPQRVGDLFRDEARRMNNEQTAGYLDAGQPAANSERIGELIQFAIPGRR